MEFEVFLERCESECKRYRNGKCKIINLCYKAMFDVNYHAPKGTWLATPL